MCIESYQLTLAKKKIQIGKRKYLYHLPNGKVEPPPHWYANQCRIILQHDIIALALILGRIPMRDLMFKMNHKFSHPTSWWRHSDVISFMTSLKSCACSPTQHTTTNTHTHHSHTLTHSRTHTHTLTHTHTHSHTHTQTHTHTHIHTYTYTPTHYKIKLVPAG